jgi:hypothetical protein
LFRRRLGVVAGSGLLSVAALLVDASASAQKASILEGHDSLEAKSGRSSDAVPTRSLPPVSERVTLVADRDDDDADGEPDGEAKKLGPLSGTDLVPVDPRWVGATFSAVANGERARLIVSGRALAWGARIPVGAMLQGLAPGRVLVVAEREREEVTIALDVHGVGMRDGKRQAVDLARDHASIERTPPARVDLDDADLAYDDPDALRLVVSSPEGASLGPVTVESVNEAGGVLDVLRDIKLRTVPCADGLTCAASAPIRFVADEVDRMHSLVSERSVRAEVGGGIIVRDARGKKLQATRVLGPRSGAAGPLGRHQLAIRAVVLRTGPNGAPAVGGTEAGAVAAVRQELALASAIWGQCGIGFGAQVSLDVKVVNPPPPYLVALGDDVGLPASGGEVKLKVEGKPLSFRTRKGWSTRQAALELQRAAERAGFRAALSENARIAPGASPSVDVVMRKFDGQLASVELLSSSDGTLSVDVGAVDLTDGLQHFGDTDSVAGTLEERALVKAVEDGDPKTVDVIVVPYFAGGGRIGESFIGSDGSSLRNVVILDRAGVRARRTSLTLAHELGHVILDEPGHPDDYGVDTPSLLMDSDASDASPFGPRRITLDECARAVKQSGPGARVPMLSEVKLVPLRYAYVR